VKYSDKLGSLTSKFTTRLTSAHYSDPRNISRNNLGITLAILGIIFFIGIASALPFKDRLFSQLFKKPSSLAVSSTDWPQLQHDSQHTGSTSVTVNPPFTPTPFKWRWLDGVGKVTSAYPNSSSVPAGYAISGMAQPIIAEGKVFIGSGTGHINAINATTGDTLWRVQLSTFPIMHTLAYDNSTGNGIVYAASADHKIYALSAANGNTLYTYQTNGAIEGAVAVYSSGGSTYILIGSSDGNLYAFQPDLTLRWKSPVDGPILSTPAVGDVDGTTKIFVGAEDMYAYSFDLNGNRLWKSPQRLNGVSFRQYWPVISQLNNLVFFSTQAPYGSSGDSTLNYESFLDCLKANNIGGDSEMNAILNGYPTCTQFSGLNNNPAYKSVFALNSADGVQPFQVPITSFKTNGNTHISPIIGQDGTIYNLYHVWDQTVYKGQSFDTNYGPDISIMNPTNGYRIPIAVDNPIFTISVQADNVHSLSMGGSTILSLHYYFYMHYINLTREHVNGRPDADLFWLVTDRNGWIPNYSWYMSEAPSEFPPSARDELNGENAASVGPGNIIYINGAGGMVTAIQAGP